MTNIRCIHNQPKKSTFKSLAKFTWFFDELGKLYIKTEDSDCSMDYNNAIDVQSGCYDSVEWDEPVTPIQNLTITIDDN